MTELLRAGPTEPPAPEPPEPRTAADAAAPTVPAVLRRFTQHRPALVGTAGLVVLVLFAVLGGLLWPAGTGPDHDQFLRPSTAHPFGTDEIGRDMLALVLRGTQFSLLIAVVVALVSTTLGVVLGAVGGFYGGWVDSLVNRVVELFLILPSIVVVGVLVVRFAGSWVMVAAFLGLTSWMPLARIIRGLTLSLREREFVLAARALGASGPRIVFRHIVPNTLDVIIVNATLTVATAVLLEAALSFIGLGVQPPDTSLGLLINQTQGYLPTTNAYLFWIPLTVIVLLSLCVNFIGDGLRDALDPKLDRVR